jgi:hypothetical protein
MIKQGLLRLGPCDNSTLRRTTCCWASELTKSHSAGSVPLLRLCCCCCCSLLHADLIPDTGGLRLIKQGLSRLGPGCIASGDAVIAMNMQPTPYAASVFILLGYFVLLLGLTYFGIWRISRRKA